MDLFQPLPGLIFFSRLQADSGQPQAGKLLMGSNLPIVFPRLFRRRPIGVGNPVKSLRIGPRILFVQWIKFRRLRKLAHRLLHRCLFIRPNFPPKKEKDIRQAEMIKRFPGLQGSRLLVGLHRPRNIANLQVTFAQRMGDSGIFRVQATGRLQRLLRLFRAALIREKSCVSLAQRGLFRVLHDQPLIIRLGECRSWCGRYFRSKSRGNRQKTDRAHGRHDHLTPSTAKPTFTATLKVLRQHV